MQGFPKCLYIFFKSSTKRSQRYLLHIFDDVSLAWTEIVVQSKISGTVIVLVDLDDPLMLGTDC